MILLIIILTLLTFITVHGLIRAVRRGDFHHRSSGDLRKLMEWGRRPVK